MSQTSWTESLKVKDLTEQIGQGFGILDTNGKIQYLNGQLAQILGYRMEEILGQPFESIQGTDTGSLVKLGLHKESDILLRSSDGLQVQGTISMYPLTPSDQGWYMLVSTTPRSDRLFTPSFLTALEHAAPRMMIVDRELKIQYTNLALSNSDLSKMIGMSALLGVQKPYRPGLQNAIEVVFEEGISGSIEMSESYPDKPTRWFVLRISPIKHGKDVLAVVLSSTDITDRVVMTQALQESEKRFRGIFDNANDGIILTDENGQISEVNSACEKILGIEKRSLLGKPIWDIQRSLMTGKSRTTEENLSTEEALASFFNQNDAPWLNKIIRGEFTNPQTEEQVYFEQQSFKIPTPNGHMLCTFVWDITRRTKDEESLKEKEERLELALHGADLGVWDWDTDKDELRFNDRYAGVLGFKPEEIEPDYDKWETLIHPDDLPLMEARWNAHVRGETKSYSSEHRMKTKSGEYKWILERGKVIEHTPEGGTKRASGTILDITERVLAEQALRVEEAKYKSIVEQSLIGIAILPEGPVNIVFANAKLGRMLGYSSNELVAMSTEEITNLVCENDRERLRDYLRQVIRNESTEESLEVCMMTKEHMILWIEISAARIEYQSKPAVQVSFVDNTKRREVEDGLRESEARRRTLLQSLNDLVLVYDESNNYAEIFTGNENILYMNPDEIIGRCISDVLPEAVSKEFLKHFREVRNTGQSCSFDYPLDLKTGHRWFSANLSLHEDGKSVVSVIRDITARYAAEKNLRRDRRIFHQLAQSFIQTKDIDKVTEIILNELASSFGFDFGLFAQYDSPSNTLRRTATIGVISNEVPPHVDLSNDDADSFIIAHVFNSKIALFISDIEREVSEKSYLSRIRKLGAKSVMAAPILDDDNNVLAVYSFATTQVRTFDAGDFEIFSTITNLLGTVLERREAEIQKQKAQETLERERQAFQSIANSVVHSTDTIELSSQILQGLIDSLGFDFGTLRLYDEKEEVLNPTAIVGIDTSKLSSSVPVPKDGEPQHLVALVAIDKTQIIASDTSANPYTLKFKERLDSLGVKSVVVWPILNETEQLVGILTIGSYESREISETTRPFFSAVSGMLNTLFERKKTEQALRISERRYRELLTDMSEGIGMADLDEKLVFVNQAFAEMLGYEQDELIGKSILDLADPEDFQLIVRQTSLRKEGTSSSYIHSLIRKDGEKRYVRVSAVPSRNDQGTVDGSVAIITDITERLQTEAALKESEVRFRNIFNSSPVGMHLVEFSDDDELTLIDSNPAAQKIEEKSGRKRFVVGQPLNYEITGLTGRDVRDRYKEILMTGKPWNLEDAFYNAEGAIIGAVQLQIFRATPHMIVTSFLDISDRFISEKKIRDLNEELAKRVDERTAELAAANKELEAFAYSVSHDLRAPLRSIDGFSQALLEDYSNTIDETGKDYLTRVRAGVSRMAELIEDILGLSRVTRSDMVRTDVNLSELAREILNEKTDAEPEREVDIRIDEVHSARCDQHLIRIVLQNLIENAWKFTRNTEHPMITFSSKEIDGTTTYYVRDNGAGFDMKYKEKLFTPFQRLHSSEEFEGSGIGLATVQRIIHRHGGNIWAESEIEKGTTIYFTIPA